jgi:Protein of unknown function (DUF4012)
VPERPVGPIDEPVGAPVRPRPPRRTTTPERRFVIGVALFTGLLSLLAPVDPTGLFVTDVLLRFGFAVVVTLAAARARRSTWIVLALGSVILAAPGLWFVSALLSLALAIATVFLPRRRAMGAVVAALAVPSLMRASSFGFTGASALCVWAVTIPILVSGYRVASRRSRERMRKIATGVALAAMVGTVIFGVTAWIASHDLSSGSRSAQSGLQSLRAGRGPQATLSLAAASSSLDSAHDVLSGWWTAPAHLVPFVSQQLDALSAASGQGHAIAAAGTKVAAKADYQQLRYVKGQVDLARVRQLQAPLAEINRVLARADRQIGDARSPWLIGPVRGALDTFSDQIHTTRPQAEVAEQVSLVAPAMLGSQGVRHYFVAFTTESESRGLNGFMGNWAELTADNGRLKLTRSERIDVLNQAGDGARRNVRSPAEHVANYGRFQVGRYFQDVTLSPDLPDVADVIRQLYTGPSPNMGGDHIDGVLVIDPYALAALLEFTGPINVAGAPTLTSANAADELVSGQYTDFTQKTDRVDFLDQASRLTFQRLTTGSIPGPDQIAKVLGPEVADRHLMFSAFDPSEQRLFTRLDASGAFPRATPGRDFLAVTGQNSANNKTDIWMHRSISYHAAYDPRTGQVHSVATIKLQNDAPTSGLPEGVIGSNGQHLPLGTNRTFLSIYSPLQLTGSAVDGQRTPFETELAFGYNVYSQYLTVPAGHTLTVTLDLGGIIDAGLNYRLSIAVQPMVNPDQFQAVVAPPGGWDIASANGFYTSVNGTEATLDQQPGHQIDANARLERQ